MPEPMITTRGSGPADARGGRTRPAGSAAARAAAPAPPSTARRETPVRSPGRPLCARAESSGAGPTRSGFASTPAASSMPQPVRRAYADTACACRSARTAGEPPQSIRPPAAAAAGTLPGWSGDGEGAHLGGHPAAVAVGFTRGVVGDDRLDRAAVGLRQLRPAELGKLESLGLLARRARVG